MKDKSGQTKPLERKPTQREARKAKRRLFRRMRRWAFFAIVGVVGGAFIVSLLLPNIAKNPGISSVDLGDTLVGTPIPTSKISLHFEPGTPIPDPYSSTPPTSGWHYTEWARWGIHTVPVPNENQVHNLEHGGVLIQYKTEDKELVTQIEGFAKKQSGFPGCLIVAPYPNMDYTIAMTAWGVLLPLEGFDETAMQSFLNAYRRVQVITTQDGSLVQVNRRGPEMADCNQ